MESCIAGCATASSWGCMSRWDQHPCLEAAFKPFPTPGHRCLHFSPLGFLVDCSPLITAAGEDLVLYLRIDISGELPKKLTVCCCNCSSLYSHPSFCFPVGSLTSAFACAWKNRPPPSLLCCQSTFLLSSELQLGILFPSHTDHSRILLCSLAHFSGLAVQLSLCIPDAMFLCSPHQISSSLQLSTESWFY